MNEQNPLESGGRMPSCQDRVGRSGLVTVNNRGTSNWWPMVALCALAPFMTSEPHQRVAANGRDTGVVASLAWRSHVAAGGADLTAVAATGDGTVFIGDVGGRVIEIPRGNWAGELVRGELQPPIRAAAYNRSMQRLAVVDGGGHMYVLEGGESRRQESVTGLDLLTVTECSGGFLAAGQERETAGPAVARIGESQTLIQAASLVHTTGGINAIEDLGTAARGWIGAGWAGAQRGSGQFLVLEECGPGSTCTRSESWIDEDALQLRDVAVTADRTAFVVVGDGGMLQTGVMKDSRGGIDIWDPPPAVDLYGVAIFSTGQVITSGDDGVIAVYESEKWSVADVDSDLRDLSYDAARLEAFIVGDGGIVVHVTKRTVRPVTLPFVLKSPAMRLP